MAARKTISGTKPRSSAPPAKICDQARVTPTPCEKQRLHPPYHVVLLDDDDHTYEYVIEMLQKLFGLVPESAFQLACEVDTSGRVIVETTTFERAEFKRDQILSFGRDWRISRCQGSMSSVIEPAAK